MDLLSKYRVINSRSCVSAGSDVKNLAEASRAANQTQSIINSSIPPIKSGKIPVKYPNSPIIPASIAMVYVIHYSIP